MAKANLMAGGQRGHQAGPWPQLQAPGAAGPPLLLFGTSRTLTTSPVLSSPLKVFHLPPWGDGVPRGKASSLHRGNLLPRASMSLPCLGVEVWEQPQCLLCWVTVGDASSVGSGRILTRLSSSGFMAGLGALEETLRR